ncbi:7079_t:CDS:10 [Ambispora leptoticha]|uniref:Molybdenum cofactor sulfurase n=1 Tax=Ambispora leptoticha TaxID=144679 RepID=A0A9N9FL14_9GLOM|nr:7079_t:CDS:10 [Ambispora leptoticha]
MPPHLKNTDREYHLPEPSKFQTDKLSFLKEFSSQYGYGGRIEQIREKEYPQLKGEVYLDHAGTTTYPQSTLTEFHADLSRNLYGNPHSKSPSSQLATDRVNQVRNRVLKHFNASPEHYEVIFTANTTAAIKLVGEIFPWAAGETSYKYLREGHTSLLGLRRFAEEADVHELTGITENEVEEDLRTFNNYRTSSNPHFLNNIPQVDFEGHTDGVPIINNGVTYNLFAYPAQCNFSGMRFPLDWSRKIKQTFNTANKKTLVLLDAAAYTTSSPLSLAEPENSPDFVTISFYKLFGYPTGLGALILKKELNPILKKRYFGGGTVTSVVWDMNWQMFHDRLCERYEDGTINFLNIISLGHAFDVTDRLYGDFKNIRAHVTALNSYLYRAMSQLKHWNGAPLCFINSDRDFSDSSRQGPILSFNLKHADGTWIGYREIERLAGQNGIHVRAGGHCNPGSVARWMGVKPEEFAGKSCSDDQDVVNGKPIGSARVSLGAMTTIDDILVWLDFLKAYFLEGEPTVSKYKTKDGIYGDLKNQATLKNTIPETKISLETITIYPIKSCHGYTVPSSKSWPITPQGLLYDREWMVVNAETGEALNQKRFPRMALIRPRILIDEGVLLLKAPGQAPLRISLDEYPILGACTNTSPSSLMSATNESKVCGDKVDTLYYTAPNINEWFSNFLGLTCVLARQPPFDNDDDINNSIKIRRRFIKPHLEKSADAPISLTNESPFLLISQSSVDDLNQKIRRSGHKEIDASCFRGNFLVKGTFGYEEDDWSMVRFGNQVFKIPGPCRRCHMVTVNQTTAEKTSEPYRTLSKHRKFDGKIYFGEHMIHVPELSEAPYVVKPGSPIEKSSKLSNYIMPPHLKNTDREYHLPEPSKFQTDKLSFLKEFSSQYGYGGRIEQIREKEYPQLKGEVYLDHAGTTTYPQSTLTEFHADLSRNLYGNPHSKSPSSQLATDRVNQVRNRVLKHFNASPEHYEVIFTANTTAAIKLVGEIFPWAAGETSYKYLREGHTSLLGLRRFAEEADVHELTGITENEVEEDLRTFNNYRTSSNPHFLNNIPQVDFEGHTDGVPIINNGVTYNLFAYPAQCNFSGMRFPLDWSRKIKQTFNTANKKTLVLLDAAAYTTSSPLSLAEPENSPDFVTISFYKLFGYPTGLGALILKKELNPILKKRYFGGGTVTSVVWDMNWQMFHDRLCERYEDGTINFLNIISLGHAFDVTDRLYGDFKNIRAHVTALNSYLYRAMSQLKHWNGAPLCFINSDRDFSDSSRQGPILSFNLKHADGTWIGYREIERLAGQNGIHVRAGGHCNPGSVARWMGVKPEEFAGKSCSDDQDVVNGKPIGSARVSLGAMTTIDDILVWLDFLKAYFLEGEPTVSKYKTKDGIYGDLKNQATLKNTIPETKISLETITIYPIKSCHGYTVPSSKSWPITPQGLLYDREWMVVNAETGEALNQKRFPRMALIRPRILIDEGVLLLKAPGQAPLRISLDEYPILGACTNTSPSSLMSATNESKVCGDKVDTLYYTAPNINEWFSNFLGLTCVLARQPPFDNDDDINNSIKIRRRFIKPHLEKSADAPISLTNESPFLLISQSSVDDLNQKIRRSGHKEIDASCFRGNFLVKGTFGYEEDDWSMVRFGNQVFKIPGPCRRCHMVTVNQTTAEKTSEPYHTYLLFLLSIYI